jgi:hypothetical protein
VTKEITNIIFMAFVETYKPDSVGLFNGEVDGALKIHQSYFYLFHRVFGTEQ